MQIDRVGVKLKYFINHIEHKERSFEGPLVGDMGLHVFENNFFVTVYVGLLHESSIFNINLPLDQLAFVLRL